MQIWRIFTRHTQLIAILFLISILLVQCLESQSSSTSKKQTEELEDDDEQLNPDNFVFLSSETEAPDENAEIDTRQSILF